MLAVVSLLAVLTIGLTITRVATIVLTTTGLSRDVARFQARSAFTGVGFTTSEAESVVGHPVRRRVIMWLVLVGNAGIVTTVTSLLLSFNDATGGETLLRTAVIVLGLVGLWLLAGSRVVDRAVHRATEWALRRYTKLELRDYDQLLHITDDYAVIELEVRTGEWLDGHRLDELALRQEGVIVLGVYRRGGREYLGVPKGDVRLRAGDVLVVYGDDQRVARLVERPAGERGWREHEQAVEGYRQQRRDRPGDAEVTP